MKKIESVVVSLVLALAASGGNTKMR